MIFPSILLTTRCARRWSYGLRDGGRDRSDVDSAETPDDERQTKDSALQGGAPPLISWFIIPITIDITPTNPSYRTYKPT